MKTMKILTITIKHPPRQLGGNGNRAHYMALKKLKDKAKEEAYIKTRCELTTIAPADPEYRFIPTQYELTWYYWRGATPDADNCLTRCKYSIDAACKAMGINDKTLNVKCINRVKNKEKGGACELRFLEQKEERRKL